MIKLRVIVEFRRYFNELKYNGSSCEYEELMYNFSQLSDKLSTLFLNYILPSLEFPVDIDDLLFEIKRLYNDENKKHKLIELTKELFGSFENKNQFDNKIENTNTSNFVSKKQRIL